MLTNPAEVEVLEDGLVQSCAFIKENLAAQSLGYNLGIIPITAVPKPASPSSLPFYRWGNRSTGRQGLSTDPVPGPGLSWDVCIMEVMSQDKRILCAQSCSRGMTSWGTWGTC